MGDRVVRAWAQFGVAAGFLVASGAGFTAAMALTPALFNLDPATLPQRTVIGMTLGLFGGAVPASVKWLDDSAEIVRSARRALA